MEGAGSDAVRLGWGLPCTDGPVRVFCCSGRRSSGRGGGLAIGGSQVTAALTKPKRNEADGIPMSRLASRCHACC